MNPILLCAIFFLLLGAECSSEVRSILKNGIRTYYTTTSTIAKGSSGRPKKRAKRRPSSIPPDNRRRPYFLFRIIPQSKNDNVRAWAISEYYYVYVAGNDVVRQDIVMRPSAFDDQKHRQSSSSIRGDTKKRYNVTSAFLTPWQENEWVQVFIVDTAGIIVRTAPFLNYFHVDIIELEAMEWCGERRQFPLAWLPDSRILGVNVAKNLKGQYVVSFFGEHGRNVSLELYGKKRRVAWKYPPCLPSQSDKFRHKAPRDDAKKKPSLLTTNSMYGEEYLTRADAIQPGDIHVVHYERFSDNRHLEVIERVPLGKDPFLPQKPTDYCPTAGPHNDSKWLAVLRGEFTSPTDALYAMPKVDAFYGTLPALHDKNNPGSQPAPLTPSSTSHRQKQQKKPFLRTKETSNNVSIYSAYRSRYLVWRPECLSPFIPRNNPHLPDIPLLNWWTWPGGPDKHRRMALGKGEVLLEWAGDAMLSVDVAKTWSIFYRSIGETPRIHGLSTPPPISAVKMATIHAQSVGNLRPLVYGKGDMVFVHNLAQEDLLVCPRRPQILHNIKDVEAVGPRSFLVRKSTHLEEAWLYDIKEDSGLAQLYHRKMPLSRITAKIENFYEATSKWLLGQHLYMFADGKYWSYKIRGRESKDRFLNTFRPVKIKFRGRFHRKDVLVDAIHQPIMNNGGSSSSSKPVLLLSVNGLQSVLILTPRPEALHKFNVREVKNPLFTWGAPYLDITFRSSGDAPGHIVITTSGVNFTLLLPNEKIEVGRENSDSSSAHSSTSVSSYS